MLIAVLVKAGAIPDTEKWSQERLLNFVVVVEMLLFAVAHYFVFPHKPYVDPAAAEVPCITACLRMLDLRDVAGDIKEHFVDPIPHPNFRIRRIVLGSRSSTGSNENSPLLQKVEAAEPLSATPCQDGMEGKTAVEKCEGTRRDTEISTNQKHQLLELGYNVITYSELDSRTGYGLRGRIIASAAEKVEERIESTGPSREEQPSTSD